jgi:uncharacterized membrane protein
MTKLYRIASRTSLGWLADAILALVIVFAWVVAGTVLIAVLHLSGLDLDGIYGALTVATGLVLAVWLGIRLARTEAYEDGHADGRSVYDPGSDEVPF